MIKNKLGISELKLAAKITDIIPTFIKAIGLETTMFENTDDIWEIIPKASRMAYPDLEKTGTPISIRAAEKMLDGRVGRNTLIKKKNDKVLRSVEKKIFKEEVAFLLIMFMSLDKKVKDGTIITTQDLSGDEYWAIHRKTIHRQGKSKQDQELQAVDSVVDMLLADPIGKAYIEMKLKNSGKK